MGRSKGYIASQEERDMVAAATRRSWEARRPWLDASKGMLEAVRSGDRELAHQILEDFADFDSLSIVFSEDE